MNVKNRTDIKKIDFIPIEKLEEFHFLVKEYQRGYKWEQEQILALLKDIDFHESGKYCLQPIIIKETKDGIELIDGQQRMTTLYLILHFLGSSQFYSIDYQTREASQLFILTKLSYLDKAVSEKKDWLTFILEINQLDEQNYDNVDIFHFYLVYSEIVKWFEDKDEQFKNQFKAKILNQIHVIWYDIENSQKLLHAEEVFLNLNAGKIPLTNSELIKALFILDVQNQYSKDLATLKSAELATEWDLIENQLHESEFWYFICDHKYYNSIDTRIDLIIDITNKIAPKKDWDGLDAYRLYEAEFLEDRPLNWESIKQTFNRLNEWYKDKELYHYVGFLIVTQLKKLSDIIKLSQGKSKLKFKEELVGIIKEELKKTKTSEDRKIQHIYDLETINYEDNRKECQNILLLLNIQYFINNSSHNKFPFDLYKNELWSVEHINPQNPRDFMDIKQIVNWLSSFEKYYNKYEPNQTEIINDSKELLNIFNGIENQNRKLSELRLPKEKVDKLQNTIEAITNDLELHNIANLALLDQSTNSKLSNNIFMEKRKLILQLYYKTKEKNVFIPECTKDVFTKNFTKENENISDEFFAQKDMDDYRKHIKEQLEIYYN